MSLLIGLLLGVTGVGLSTLRTILASDGHVISSFIVSMLASLNVIIFTKMVIDGDIPFLVGNVLGGAVSVALIAYYRKKGYFWRREIK